MRIVRSNFVEGLREKQVSLQKMNADRGISSDAKRKMSEADINNDGYIRGTSEFDRLFSKMDYYDRDGNINSVDTSNTNVRAIHGTLMRSTEALSTSAPSSPQPTTRLGELLANNPSLKTNQDLLNFFLRRNQNNWTAAASDARRYDVDMNGLLDNREGRIQASGGSTQPTAPTPPTNDSSPTSSIGRVAGMERTSPAFRQKVVEIANRLGMSPRHLMAVMSFETGETFSPSERNRFTGATGLIQFMPATARSLGTSTHQLSQMSPERQLDYVERYLRPYAGRMNSLEDAYMAVLWPAAVGRGPNHVLFRRGTQTYRQNSGLDVNRNGLITASEAASKVRAKLR